MIRCGRRLTTTTHQRLSPSLSSRLAWYHGYYRLDAAPSSVEDTNSNNNNSNNTSLVASSGDFAPRYPHLLGLPIPQRPIFPNIPTSIVLKDPTTIGALETGKYVGTFLRKTASENILTPPELITSAKELYSVGTLCQILKMTPLPDPLKIEDPQYNNNNNNNNNEQHAQQSLDSLSSSSSSSQEHESSSSDHHVSLWVLGHRRIDLSSVDHLGPPVDVTVQHWDKLVVSEETDSIRALTNEIVSMIREVAQMNPLFRESLNFYNSTQMGFVQDAYRLADFVAFGLCKSASGEELQAVLEEKDAEKRLHLSLVLLSKEREVAKLQLEISQKVEETMTEQQRKYMLQQQLKSIKQELGMEQNDKDALLQKYQESLERNGYDKDKVDGEVRQALESELSKLETLETNSQEYTVTRSYLDWLCAMPWNKSSPPNSSVTTKQAKALLDEEHYGMKDVKQAILQYLAVRKLNDESNNNSNSSSSSSSKEEEEEKDNNSKKNNKHNNNNNNNKHSGTILCLAGPPGVGKTSIASSIAKALGREFYRFSVGGLSDVSELKGHRRTYLGSMPGKFIQSLKRVGVNNPVLLIDEIDKLGAPGFRGDPSGAMLEILDPSQNHAFRDLYLDVPVDLSDAVFLCTANDVDQIPGPLRDRMEIIRVSGYDLPEKVAIAQQYLVPKALSKAGLLLLQQQQQQQEEGVEITTGAMESLARWYAREAGVRNLSKLIEKIARQLALSVVVNREKEKDEDNNNNNNDDDDIEIVNTFRVTAENLSDFVGKPIFTSDRLYDKDPLPLGIVMGLAYTSMGGSALYVETMATKSKKNNNTFTVTGQLGDVMKESSQIAMTVARSYLEKYNCETKKQNDNNDDESDDDDDDKNSNNFLDTHSFHLHVPEGATPKDGPSAGVTMVTSILSLALSKPCASEVAMTGEVTLSGKVLPVGGIREKTMAARRAGITTLCLPDGNRRDWDELPYYLQEGLTVHFCQDYDDVYRVAFSREIE
eukprot:CAMPEP_0178924246 /NCGR_PEP_ID=MMETSP0786-20121207/17215_1 /TAXON_ID=186022 /ORGANISM="Thalassionema frauenfeldii, Strain CCMP 1798" /LENGTH=992 /DNA_ID=CAMNT_0020598925 /DNA_START=132 /DNA_END=3110 /DNA_ORIENTATION=-